MLYLILAGFACFLIYELWAVYTKELTLSQHIWRLSTKFPVIPFAFGLLMGHFFL